MCYNKNMKIQSAHDYDLFVERLFAARSDEEYLQMNKRITRTNQKMIGVRTPDMRKIAKEIVRDNAVGGLFRFGSDEYFEETTVRGLALGGLKDAEQITSLLPRFIPSVDNWATCDVTCGALKAFDKNADAYFDCFASLTKSKAEFSARFGFIMLMCHYLDEKHVDEILRLAKECENHAYYVDMGVAWLLATAMAKFEDKVLELLNERTLTKFVQNKTVQKTRESFRIPSKTKQKILEYKIV